MIDDQVIITAERLRDELVDLKASLRERYRLPTRQVTADDLKARAARAAETWMVDLAVRGAIRQHVSSDYLADLNVQFQRLLTSSEHASQRTQYDFTIQAILKRFTLNLIIPVKQARSQSGPPPAPVTPLAQPTSGSDGPTISDSDFVPSAFVGHSFLPNDKGVAVCVTNTLTVLGIAVVTGEKPKAERISEKVKRLIDGQYIFVGVFTCRDKIARKKEWTTTSWVVDEKAYAVGKNKKLVLVKEEGVGSIGGIQGDYEFIEFSRDRLEDLVAKLTGLFRITVIGFQS